ncbi:aspartate aminotransferase family protein [bacterium]|nr:aspartate aminotransferase family protein [bacterium]
MPDHHLPPEEFRRRGHQLVDWIADYWARVEDLPVRSAVEPGAVRARLPEHAPARGEDWDAILQDIDDIILPGVTHWQSPNWFAYFPANASGPAVLGELLAAGLGVQGMLWSTSPACTELETHVLDWLVEMLGLPARFRSDGPGGGVLQDTASSAVLCALLAARERCDGDPVAYCSTQTHSSVEKAVRVAGLGVERLRAVETDAAHAMNPAALRARMEADRAAGLTPAFVCATLGTTSSHAFDPVPAVAEVCAVFGAWLHVDAAHAGTAALCPEFRWQNEGLERVDSYCFNPHKWMFTNFDCDCFWVADRGPLLRALSILPEYLRNAPTESGAVIDYRDWHIPLGRRFRALKLWFVIRHYGVEGLRHHVREHVRLAQDFAGRVANDPDWELAAPAPLNLVCFRHHAGDAATERILEAVNASGELFLTHTRLNGRYVIRMSIGQTHTQERHVRAAWEALQKAGRSLA